MPEQKQEKRAPVLDPISRMSEIIFGLLMALTFTGSLNAATTGREEVRTMMLTALGCNLAWGLVDAVMYLVGTYTQRARSIALWRRVRNTVDPQEAHDIITEALPDRLGKAIGTEGLEDMLRRLRALAEPPARARLDKADFLGALGVFLLVVLATFPVVVPFILFSRIALAMRISNAIALVILFAAGSALGHYSGGIPWRAGLLMAALGGALVSIIVALGG